MHRHKQAWVISTKCRWVCISGVKLIVLRKHECMLCCTWKPRCVCKPDFHTLCGPASRGEEKRNLTLGQQNQSVCILWDLFCFFPRKWLNIERKTEINRWKMTERENRKQVSLRYQTWGSQWQARYYPRRRVSQKRWVNDHEQEWNHDVDGRMISQ